MGDREEGSSQPHEPPLDRPLYLQHISCTSSLVLKLLGYFACFFVFHQLFRKIHSMSNSLDPDRAGYFVGPDLGPNCLQRLTTDDCIKQRVNTTYCDLIAPYAVSKQ